MRKRVRHFNPRDAGAVYAIDARRLALSNNDPVSQWDDISRTGKNVSQSTSGARPTYVTGQSGGCPSVDFDGGDYLVESDSGLPTGNLSIITTAYFDLNPNSNTYHCVQAYGQASIGSAVYVNFANIVAPTVIPNNFGVSQYGNTVATPNSTQQWIVGSITRNGTSYSVRRNNEAATTGTMQTNTTLAGANGFTVGSSNGPRSYVEKYDGRISTLSIFPSELSDALRSRIVRSFGFSFKIKCA